MDPPNQHCHLAFSRKPYGLGARGRQSRKVSFPVEGLKVRKIKIMYIRLMYIKIYVLEGASLLRKSCSIVQLETGFAK